MFWNIYVRGSNLRRDQSSSNPDRYTLWLLVSWYLVHSHVVHCVSLWRESAIDERSLIRELILYEFYQSHNAEDATKTFLG